MIKNDIRKKKNVHIKIVGYVEPIRNVQVIIIKFEIAALAISDI